MSLGKGRILSIIFGTAIYMAFLFYGILNYPMSWVIKVFFKAPVVALAISLTIWLIVPDRTKRNDQPISGILFWANILWPILLGLIAFWYVVNGNYKEIDWVMLGLAFSIGLNGWELVRGNSESSDIEL